MNILDKHVLPNLIALAVIAISFLLTEPLKAITLQVGLFALSGAITNWLAVHMLFERIPGLYGSGVIPLHFEEFKGAILNIVTEHLFKKENVEAAFSGDESTETIDLGPVLSGLDLNAAYDQLIDVIMTSSFGAMLGMVGGAQALEPMREPFCRRMEKFLQETSQSPRFQQVIRKQLSTMTGSEAFMEKIITIVKSRLDELTPEMVKSIVQDMIRQHLGWLVVWGGVFGGLIGLVTALLLHL